MTRRIPRDLQQLHAVRADRQNLDEPVPGLMEVVPPAWLKGGGLKTWKRLAPDLERLGVLTAWDTDLFARFCWAESLSADLMKSIDAEGALVPGVRGGEMVKHKNWPALRQLTTEMLSIGAKFGLTPVDRANGRTTRDPNPHPAERLLSGNNDFDPYQRRYDSSSDLLS